MPHHKQISRHGAQVGNGVEQRLALGGRGSRDVQIDDIGAQARRGDLKGGAGAGGVLKKQVEHAFAAQQGHFLDLAVVDTDKVGRGIEHLGQDAFRQALDRQQVYEFSLGIELGVAAGQHG